MAAPANRRWIMAWSIYDLANTVFSALFITLFFPDFIKTYLGGTETHLGLILGVSTIASVLLVPLVGALSDRIGRRMPFLIVFTIGCCAATAGVAFSGLFAAIVFAILANFFYSIAIAVYDALLPKLADEGERGQVSGLGTAIGYLGTPLSVGAVAAMMYFLGWNTERGVRGTFILTAVLFMVIALYPFLVIREPKTPSGRTFGAELSLALRSIGRTLATVHRIPGFLLFLIGVFLYGNAIYAVIAFLYLFSQSRLGLTPQQFVGIYVAMAVVAAGGSYLAGRLTDRIGPRKVLLIEGILWLVVLVSLMNVRTVPPFVAAGCLGGVALGAHWTATRPLLIRYADPERMGEYFGFLALVNKASGALGPLVFGPIAAREVVGPVSGYTAGLITLAIFFLVGMGSLYATREKG